MVLVKASIFCHKVTGDRDQQPLFYGERTMKKEDQFSSFQMADDKGNLLNF